MKLYQKLGDLRKEKGLSQEDLAEALNVSRQTISKWETGVTAPSSGNLTCLSRVLGVSMDELMHGKEPAAEAKDAAPESRPARLEEPQEQTAPSRRFAGKKWIVFVICLLLALAFLVGMYFGAKQSDARNPMSEMKSKEVEIDPDQSFSIEPIV